MSRMLRVNVPVRAPPQAQDSEAAKAGCVPRWCRRAVTSRARLVTRWGGRALREPLNLAWP